jgi:hypothetical protein
MAKTIRTEDIGVAAEVRETATEDGAVLLDVEQGICFSLNPVGLKIWGMLKQHHYSMAEIADALEREFHMPRAELVADISDFLTQLEAKHLLRGKEPPPRKDSWLVRIAPWRRGQRKLD